MSESFTPLERNILLAKGITASQLDILVAAGVSAKSDFATVGDAATLAQLLPGLGADIAGTIMEWAIGPAATATGGSTTGEARVLVDTADIVNCIHCGAEQPKDYRSGDLCPACGKQAEPILACYWCGASGPGKFCRRCGASFVPTAELDLALLLKREGLAKDAIPLQLAGLSAAEKDDLWGRVRRSRG